MKYAKTHKLVIINRAVPGSGKTTISRCIENFLAAQGVAIATHSTDNFFMQGQRYCFDLAQLSKFHRCNLAHFEADLAANCPVVICDNTNLLPWQSAPYTRLARQYGYKVLFLNFFPRELAKHVQSQQITPTKPDAHQVPESRLAEFIVEFNTYNALLNRANRVQPHLQRHYVWNDQLKRPEDTGIPAAHFDADEVIDIQPTEYRAIQPEIGRRVWNCLLTA